jgi:hypothetical protein
VMLANKRLRIRSPLRPMPLSELPIMKALMGLPPPPAGTRPPKRSPKEDRETQLARLMTTIIDKLQILALRRPRALIIVAQVLDGLLKQQLDALDNDRDNEHIEKGEVDHTAEDIANTRVASRPTRGQRARG